MMEGRELEELVKIALEEDGAEDDITTAAALSDDPRCTAVIIARQDGVISGHECAEAVFNYLDPEIEYSARIADGESVVSSGTVAELKGRAAPILAGERVALNFLGHLSGIASLARSYADKVAGTGVTVLDTRKTTPGLRLLEKKAVRDGGCSNHRTGLADYILVKENHIAAAGGLEKVIRNLGERIEKAEIEVDSPGMLKQLLERPPARIMLDNFSPEMVAGAVAEIGDLSGRKPEIEVSGGITLDSIVRYAIPGVDFISTGSITASAPAIDLSMIVQSGIEGGDS